MARRERRAGEAGEHETSLRQMPESYYKNDMYYPGQMGPADMPADSHMGPWSDQRMGDYAPINDTMSGIDSVQTESYLKARRHSSKQK